LGVYFVLKRVDVYSSENVSRASLSFFKCLFLASISGVSFRVSFVLKRVDVYSKSVPREIVSFSSSSFLRSLFLASISGLSFCQQESVPKERAFIQRVCV